ALVVDAVQRWDVGPGVDVDARVVDGQAECVTAPLTEVGPEAGVAHRVQPVEPVEAHQLAGPAGGGRRLDPGDEGAHRIGRRAVGVGRTWHDGLVGHLEHADARVGRHHAAHPGREAGDVAFVSGGRHVLEGDVDGESS